MKIHDPNTNQETGMDMGEKSKSILAHILEHVNTQNAEPNKRPRWWRSRLLVVATALTFTHLSLSYTNEYTTTTTTRTTTNGKIGVAGPNSTTPHNTSRSRTAVLEPSQVFFQSNSNNTNVDKDNSDIATTTHYKHLTEIRDRSHTSLAEIFTFYEDRGETDSKTVANKGFPWNWEPCTLNNILSEKKELTILWLGGSSSAIPPSHCDGRPSDLLQQALQSKLQIDIKVINMAQGNTDSGVNALLLDQLLQPCDFIVWEFAINDHNNGAMAEIMELWLRRLHNIFVVQHNETLPPLLMLYLWNVRINSPKRKEYMGKFPDKSDLSSDAWQYQQPILEYYTKYWQWNTQIVNVGAVVRKEAVLKEPALLFHDYHHPSCNGAHLIASMVQHAIYANLIGCSADQQQRQSNTELSYHAAQGSPPRTQLAESNFALESLMSDNESVRVGSICRWEPHVRLGDQLVNPTVMALADNNATVLQQHLVLAGKAAPGRYDRKYSYRIPVCNNDSRNNHTSLPLLQMTIVEPSLKWIGISFGNNNFHGNKVRPWVNLTINDQAGVPLESTGNYPLGDIQAWIRMQDLINGDDRLPEQYSIALCLKASIQEEAKQSIEKVYMNYLVGVMLET